ncbi:hypothetical protein A3C57_02015 [Candidatus Nomurabacteria bacterium RIFCSPHIGHO2_02_FULL_33_12]|nr:MAG: hypothetical protein A3C57_02015 [Candidatus Nomurabacteria bacterium RIFCSPHIGHO2_02_FULL_33_12]
MAYLHDNQYFGLHKKKVPFLRYVFVFVVLIGLIFLFKKSFNKFAYTVAVPILSTGDSVSRGLYSMTHTKANLLNRIEYLESQNAELNTKLINYNLLENENIGFKNSTIVNNSGTIAIVIARPSKVVYDTLLIKSNSNIEQGINAYSLSGVPLGNVIKTEKNGSTVKLYSTPGNEVDANLILYNVFDSIDVTLRGRGGGSFEAVISKDVIIPIGSLVFLPNISDMPFAEVVKIHTSDDTKDQIIYFRSTVNFQYLRYVILK